MNNIQNNIKKIYHKISITNCNTNQKSKKITLVLVTKNQSINSIKTAISFKQINFGENYVQESLPKINWFKKNIKQKLTWHFIGTIQSNKTKIISENFDWCHTVTSDKVIHQLNRHRPQELNRLNVLIQINVSNDQNRHGISTLDQMYELAKIINHCPKLKLRGIMSMSNPFTTDFKKQLIQFKTAYFFFQKLKTKYLYIDTLSMGMSNDMTAAIYAGSNLIRIGKSIFSSK